MCVTLVNCMFSVFVVYIYRVLMYIASLSKVYSIFKRTRFVKKKITKKKALQSACTVEGWPMAIIMMLFAVMIIIMVHIIKVYMGAIVSFVLDYMYFGMCINWNLLFFTPINAFLTIFFLFSAQY